MFERLKLILSKVDADYADIRYEKKEETRIVFNRDELTQVDSNTTDGFVLRFLKNGGLSSIAFTKEDDSDEAIRKCERNAQIISKNIDRPVEFAEVEIIKDTFLPELKEDPRKVSIQEKIEITRNYNRIPLKYDGIVTTTTEYREVIREKFFVSTEGSEIKENLVTTRIGGVITSSDNNILQQVRVGGGGSSGFAVIRRLEEEFEKRTKVSLDLLKAKPVSGGTYNAVLNPDLAGVFTHEAFGHFSEADLIEDNPTMKEKMKIGEKLGNEVVNIIDNPTIPDQLGFYEYDDEGVKVRPTQLMKNGILVGRLHSRRTAAAFEEPVTGHCVAEDYRYAPIIRMGTIFIQPGSQSFDDLLLKLKDGLYLLDAMGGQTSGENFTFGAQYGYEIKNGRIGEMIRDINISGNLYRTLQSIVGVGDDLELSKVGGCGKGQLNIRSCLGAPHILVNGIVIGGS
ncbi:MAG: TldD/PmbA family protein [candidate division WOR-3 bacterium]|nr:TldD/PmbA family protein [candidate division WOR-3 bacterium]